MLSISALKKGPSYYLELASVSYYELGGEPLPVWAGTAAKEFGLSGTAAHEHVRRLCAGFDHEDEGHRLVRNAGRKSRNPGQDCTFSMPKSASVIFALADPELRRKIQDAQLSAVKQALSYLEDKAGFARVGTDGQKIVRCPLLAVLFEHGTSRALDPQLHTHALIINLTMHPDGPNGKRRTTAIDSTYLYHYKMAAGAIYRAALAQEIQKLGFQVKQRQLGSSIGFDVVGVPEALMEEFSKRRAEMEKLLNLRGGSLDTAGAKYAELACKETRRTKDGDTPRAELFEQWREVGRQFGFGPEQIRQLLKLYQRPTPEERAAEKATISKEAIASIEEQHAHFNEVEFSKRIAERAIGRISAKDVRELIENKLRSPELCPVGELTTENPNHKAKQYVKRTEIRYSTPAILKLERQMLLDCERVVRGPRSDTPKALVAQAIEAYLKRGGKLDAEQRRAVEYITGGPGIRVLCGMAGTGKTNALTACVDAWRAEKPNRRIIGCAVNGAAAERLQEGIGKGIECRSLESLLYRLEHGMMRLDASSVVVVDEAGMAGTRQLARLLTYVARAQARLVLVGDAKQLQPIEGGGPFKYLADALGHENVAKLTKIYRQKEEWARDAVKAMEAGRADEAVKSYIERGRFHLTEDREEAIKRLVERFKLDGGVTTPEKVVVLASLNVEVRDINLKIQAERIRAGLVDETKRLLANGVFFHPGDRIQFQAGSTPYGLKNSDGGTVLDVDEKKITVRLDKDGGREVVVDLGQYSKNNFRLGYASTTHKAQGASIEFVHILMGGNMQDLHMGYVQLSRGIKDTHLFCDKETAGGPQLVDLIRSLKTERQKTMAQEIREKHPLPGTPKLQEEDFPRRIRREIGHSL